LVTEVPLTSAGLEHRSLAGFMTSREGEKGISKKN